MNTSSAITLTRKQAEPILRVSFPDYKGRKIRLILTNSVRIYNLNWSGGSKNFYVAIRWDGESYPLDVPAPWMHNLEWQKIDIPVGHALVEESIICGKNLGITIHLNLSDFPKLAE